MGQFIFCDMCGSEIPTEKSAQAVVISEAEICRVCYNCSQRLKNTLLQSRNSVYTALKMDAKAKLKEAAEDSPQPGKKEEPAPAGAQ